jgi:translation initiation factor IF-2
VAKARVSALAKEIGLPSKQLIEWLNSNGEYVKTPSSTVEAPVIAKVHAAFPTVVAEDAPKPAATSAAAKQAAPAAAPAPTEDDSARLSASPGSGGRRARGAGGFRAARPVSGEHHTRRSRCAASGDPSSGR